MSASPAAIKHERIRYPIPTRELERRWSAIRAAMKAQGIGCLVLQNDNQYLGGYCRYLTDIPTEQAYPWTVLFPQDEEMTLILHGGPPPSLPAPPDYVIRGVKERINQPYLRTLHYTNHLDAQEAVKVLKRRGDKKVGLVGLGAMQAAFYKYLTENLPNVQFVEFTDPIDQLKAVKSEDELVYIRKTVETHDMVFAAMPTIIRPGMYEYQVRSEIARVLTDLGSEEQLIMMSSAPAGQRAVNIHSFYQNRQIQWGDQVMIMIEPNGPGGFYGEIGRTWCLGEAPQELLKLWDIAVEAQEMTAKMVKPGARPADVFNALNKFLAERGQPLENRLFAHGQGYDLVERPAFRPDEDMVLKANMFVALHPTAASATAYAWCCDNFLITEQGGVRLHKTPREIFVINC
jgi:Xaa-Pro aminopeptidase